MGYSLVIVESPAKAKTIQNFLEGDYVVTASKGHIRDLPKFMLGVKIENGKVQCRYEVTPDHKSIVKYIVDMAKKADKIYLATDEDREGEAIAFHIAEVIGKDIKDLPRIVFHEITKSAITHALETPRRLNINMVNSQQARRALDRIVGFNLSSLLAKKIGKGMSAGRVQSSTLSIVVDREREIMNFKPVKYEIITGVFEDKVNSNLVRYKGEKIEQTRFQDPNETRNVLEHLKSLDYKITSIDSTNRKTRPNPPFTTSTLQQTASNKLGYSPDRTMKIAQKLYEGVETDTGKTGVITYMRTDSLNVAKEAQKACRDFLLKNYGKDYLCEEVRNFVTNSKGAQEAHEAIRPTNINFTPEIAEGYLEPDQLALYKLIYNRFLATQSTDTVFLSTKMVISSNDGSAQFEANGSVMVFDGFQKFTGNENKEKFLPKLSVGHQFSKKEIKSESKETQPPHRYTEASLVSKMEAIGIGRPSTYAATIALLLNRGYVVKEGKSLRATESSFTVIDALRKHFPNIVDTHFTASLETDLDVIASGEKDWETFLSDFNSDFTVTFDKAKETMENQKPEAVLVGRDCPKCGKPMVSRKGKFGEFVACSGYPKCKHIEKSETQTNSGEETNVDCPKCSHKLHEMNGKFGIYYKCNQDSGGCGLITKYLPIPGSKCDKCGGYMVMKFGKPSCPECNKPKQTGKKVWKSKPNKKSK